MCRNVRDSTLQTISKPYTPIVLPRHRKPSSDTLRQRKALICKDTRMVSQFKKMLNKLKFLIHYSCNYFSLSGYVLWSHSKVIVSGVEQARRHLGGYPIITRVSRVNRLTPRPSSHVRILAAPHEKTRRALIDTSQLLLTAPSPQFFSPRPETD
jgi:hypothetical protein